ncbi:hypothetical protein ACIG5E_01670 [Kitasatospora sp. NPDC053057]|uniref:hypothetical protein n=1 Tax=Kitasatospora sp. NPDC053057 TaxID=3364062 RepID=UPI0037C94024
MIVRAVKDGDRHRLLTIEQLQEFEALGVDTLILSGNPLLEEAHRVAETVLPALGIRRQGRAAGEWTANR